jgi:glucose/arabinose dehydrogenase
LVFICISSLTSFSVRADNIEIQQIGPTLENPWGMDFINDSELLVTEKKGRIYRINISDGSSSEIHNLPKVSSTLQGGLLDIIYNDELFIIVTQRTLLKELCLQLIEQI